MDIVVNKELLFFSLNSAIFFTHLSQSNIVRIDVTTKLEKQSMSETTREYRH